MTFGKQVDKPEELMTSGKLADKPGQLKSSGIQALRQDDRPKQLMTNDHPECSIKWRTVYIVVKAQSSVFE